ncbi:MAG: hypothetical protein Q7T26_10580 [Dehalococcoidia bacterium]|nr:hypothetical protein [Dehalococcoidia bacterium]
MADERSDVSIVKPVPKLPSFRLFSPEVVRVLDRIRFHLHNVSALNQGYKYAEFFWFAREYPRCYRYHLDCADFRLRTISDLYQEIRAELTPTIRRSQSCGGVSVSNEKVQRVYWDFESFLSEINIALDLLARVAGTAYKEEMPANFNRFCKKEGDAGPLGVMQKAQLRWVNKLKNYRDCFVHYTPVDTLLTISLVRCADGFEVRGKLPINPNVRDILGFRFSRRVELFRYACAVQRNMAALDKAVAKEIARAFARGEYPRRITNLFFVGRRERQ